MDSNGTSNITDDQELAKVLESMNQQASSPVVPPIDETDELATPEATPVVDETPTSKEAPVVEPTPEATPEPTPEPAVVEPVVMPTPSEPTPVSEASSDLDSIKKSALEELRPLVDKLDLPADEKFDTLLLLIRSTDDKTLVGAAHEAARGIADETKRAQALLDVIKEIDYFSGHGTNPAL